MVFVDIFKGVYIISAYFKHTEGWSADNCRLMRHLAELIASLGGLWIICGDFNMEPELLAQSHWTLGLGC
eukprot:7348507-Karenia_brevis.AAC.1